MESEPRVAVCVDNPYNRGPRADRKPWLRQRKESWDIRLDQTGSDGGPGPGVCVSACKGGDGGFRIGSGKGKERELLS